MLDKKNFFFYLLPSIVSGVIGIILVPITTFFLDPKDFGIFAILSAFVVPLTALSGTGTGWVLGANFFKLSEEERPSLISNVLFFDALAKLFWFLLGWFLSPFILSIITAEYQPEYVQYFRFVLISMLTASFTASISYLLVYKKDAKRHAALEIIGPVTSAIVTVACLTFLKLKTIALFLGPLAAELLSLLVGLWFIRRSFISKIKIWWLKEIWKVGMPSMPLDFITLLSSTADRFFIQRWLNLSALGIYAHSIYYRSIFNLGFKAFNRTYAPHALEQYSNSLPNRDPAIELRLPLRKWFGLTGIAGVFVTLFSHEIVNVLTHGKFIEAAPLVPLWYLIVLTSAYGTTYIQYLFVHKKSIFLSISGIILAIVSIGIMAGFIYFYGLIGAVIGAVIANFLTQLSFRWYARRHGCSSIGEKDFFIITALLLTIYLFNINFDLSFLTKTILAIVVSAILLWFSKLWNTILKPARSIC